MWSREHKLLLCGLAIDHKIILEKATFAEEQFKRRVQISKWLLFRPFAKYGICISICFQTNYISFKCYPSESLSNKIDCHNTCIVNTCSDHWRLACCQNFQRAAECWRIKLLKNVLVPLSSFHLWSSTKPKAPCHFMKYLL